MSTLHIISEIKFRKKSEICSHPAIDLRWTHIYAPMHTIQARCALIKIPMHSVHTNTCTFTTTQTNNLSHAKKLYNRPRNCILNMFHQNTFVPIRHKKQSAKLSQYSSTGSSGRGAVWLWQIINDALTQP